MGRIYVGGVHAVGKSSILNRVEKELSEYDFISFSGLMVNYTSVSSNASVSSRDELIYLSYEKRAELKAQAHEYLSKRDNFIVDSHFSLPIKNENGMLERIEGPGGLIDYCTGFILIDAEPEIVLQRRLGEEAERRITNKKIIELELLVERMFAKIITSRYNKPLYVIDNSEELGQSCDEFIRVVREIEKTGKKIEE